jgi:hypothetical protein
MNYTSRYHHAIHIVDRVKDPVAQDPPDTPDPVKPNGPRCPTLGPLRTLSTVPIQSPRQAPFTN